MENANARIFYFDALRAFAIFCVVLLHVTGHLSELMGYNIHTIYSLSGIYETFANNFFRMGVDLFLMISGALLLGRNWNVGDFFKKRFSRLSVPFIFWSLVFSIMLIASSYFISNIHFVKDFTIQGLFNVFIDTLLFRAPGSVVYWFFWMMMYVYLMMPLLNRWIKNNESDKLEYFLILWAVFITLACPLNNQYLNLISEFLSPIGLVVLGYYLRYTKRKVFNSLSLSVILIIVSSIAMLIYSYSVVSSNILFVFHRYSLLVVLLSVGVFCLFKNSNAINNASGGIVNVVSSIALCSYGIYLIHSQIIMATRRIFSLSSNFLFDYLMLFIVGFFLSWFIIYVLAKIPIVDKLIGVK